MEASLDLFDAAPAVRTMPQDVQGSAAISRCGTYRWELRRWWRAGPPVAWLMLNPSTADGLHDDPTLRRIIGFSYRWGYGGLVVVNLYPFRASKPADLWQWCGQGMVRAILDNYTAIDQAAQEAALRIVAFGAVSEKDPRHAADCAELFQSTRDPDLTAPLHCLGTTKDGAPLHPMARGKMRVPDDQQPVLWRAA